MSTPKPNAPATATNSNRPVAAPSTPVNNISLTSISTPKSHHTPGGHGFFASPAQKGTPRPVGTPSRSGFPGAGKTMPGGKTIGAKTFAGAVEALGTSGVASAGTPAFTFGTPGLNFGSPAVTLTSPNASGAGTTSIDAFANPGASFGALDGGVGMGINLSNLGINMTGTAMSTSASAMGKADDAERRRRLDAILQTIWARPGRISREGLERLGRRCGLDIQPGEVDELAMAGKNVMVDIKFAPHQSQAIDRLAVAFATASDSMTEHAEKAANILRNDLIPPPGVFAINATLDKFADNLGRLALMDKLSTPGASCFDAVFGVYTSLKRLFEHEKKMADQILGTSRNRHKVEKDVLCKNSGMPQMHIRDRVGLSLDYWMDHHLVDKPDSGLFSSQDGNDGGSSQEPSSPVDTSQFSTLVIECEPTPTTLYPTISITSDWLSERVEKPADDIEMTKSDTAAISPSPKPVIDWLEPPPLILPPPESNASQALNDGTAVSHSNHPTVRFVAKLEPPVAFPLLIAAQIYASVGVDISQDPVSPNTIPSLVLPQHFRPASAGEQFPKSLRTLRTVVDRSENQREYDLGLYPTRIEVARWIDSLPFVHPRQLIAIMPVLRQYTLIAKLLHNTFSSKNFQSSKDGLASNGTGARPEGLVNRKTAAGSKASVSEAELAALLSGTSSPESRGPQALHVAFTTTPVPQLTVIFSSSRGAKRVTLNILPNAEIEIVEQNVDQRPPDPNLKAEATLAGTSTEGTRPGKKVEAALAQALAVCEDLAVWVEWIKHKFVELDVTNGQ